MSNARGVGSYGFTLDTYDPTDASGSLIDVDILFRNNGRLGVGQPALSGTNMDNLADLGDLSRLRLDAILKELAARTPKDYAINRKYYDGDHWQKGAGWSGPMPASNDPDYDTVREQVRKAFRSKNAIKEVIRRHRNGVIGRDPGWYFIDRANAEVATVRGQPERQNVDSVPQSIRNVEEVLTSWWTKRRVHSILQSATDTGLLAGRSVLRLFIPAGALNSDGTLINPPTTLAEALEYIYVHEVSPTQGAVLVDKNTMQEAAVHAVKNRDGSAYAELSFVSGYGDDAVTLLFTMNVPKGELVSSQPRGVSTTAAEYSMGGHLHMFELKFDQLVTQQVREQQQAINEACTMARVNGHVAGFLERTILNGQLPGHYEEDANGRKVFVRDEYAIGPAAVNHIAGIPQFDQDQRYIGLTNPSIVYRQPVSPKTFDDTKLMAYRDLLDEVDQTHHLMASDEYVSGDARKMARADFIASLRPSATALNAAGTWLLEAVLNTALWLLPDELRATDQLPEIGQLNAVFTVRIDAGPATTEGIRSAIELRAAQGLSRQTMQTWAGVDDPAAEALLIEKEEREGITAPTAPSGREAGLLSKEQADRDRALENRENGREPRTQRTPV